ncbi:helix-turn-helix domain-containing protein [Isoptericola sp. NPDC058082]|uniref:helix-turn-helix domain-containing protein n=1 Tax=Isoptericola sp. NPDC058082 TaxID=3346331 RepID=UPI0036E832AD
MSTETAVGTVPPVTLGWRLQIALGHGDVSVQDMADELGVSRSTVSRWLNEHGAPPRPAFVKLWALRTGVSYAWLRDGWAPRGSNPEPAD